MRNYEESLLYLDLVFSDDKKITLSIFGLDN